MKKITVIGIAVSIHCSSLFAQLSTDLKHAEDNYKKGEYYSAVVNYEVYLGIRKTSIAFSPYSQKKVQATKIDTSLSAIESVLSNSKLVTTKIAFELAECYRQQFHYLKAEKAYARVIAKGSDKQYPLARYWYAVCLRSNNKFQEANTQIDQFIAENSGNPQLVALGTKEKTTLAYIAAQLKNPQQKLFSVNKLKGNIAQTEGAYAPYYYNDTLLFTSARIVDTINKYSKENSHVNHLFYNIVGKYDSIEGKATMIRFPQRIALNEGTPALTPDRTKLYFARSTSMNGKSITAIYVSNKQNDSLYTEPTKLGETINKAGYNCMQPSITEDGAFLLFASDRDGGVGKFDIWAATLDASGNIGQPFNLKSINTAEDEQAPYYHVPSNSLVFSSKGYDGMGGFDFYRAAGSLTNLKAPINIGFPVNSPKDEIYFYSASKDSLLTRAFISSDRASDCCLEMFALYQQKPPKKPNYKQSLKGDVLDCATSQPIVGAAIKVDLGKKDIPLTSNANGIFEFADASKVKGFDISKDGFASNSFPFSKAKNLTNDTLYVLSFCLDAIKVKTVEQVKDSVNTSEQPLVIYFDYDKASIRGDATLVLDKVVGLLKNYPTINVLLEVNGYTDSKGSVEYNLKLGKRRADACKRYLIEQGTSDKRLLLSSYGEQSPVAPNSTNSNQDNPEGRALNRRVEMKVKAKK